MSLDDQIGFIMSSLGKLNNWELGAAFGILMFASFVGILLGKPYFLAGFAGLIIALIITFLEVKIAIVISLVWAFFQYLFTRDLKILPEALGLIDELFLVSIACYMTYQVSKKNIKIRITLFEIVLMLFVFLGVISCILNNNPAKSIVLGLRCYLQYIVLFYALTYIKLSEGFCKYLIKIILFLAALQVPFMIYQYFTWTPTSVVNDHADAAYGTFSFGAANILGVLLLVMILLVLKTKNEMTMPIRLSLIAMLSLGMILSHSKIVYLMFIALFLIDCRAKIFSKSGLRRIIISVIMFMIVIKIALLISEDITNLLSAEKFSMLIENQFTDKEGGGRILYFILTVGILFKHTFSVLIGLGPGMYSSYAGIASNSGYLTNLLGLDLEKRGARLDPDIIGMIGEYGFIGIVIFTLLILILYKRSQRTAKYHCDIYWASYAAWFNLFVYVFYFGGFVNSLWQAQFFAINFWIAAGVMNKQYSKIVRCNESITHNTCQK